MAGQDVRRDGTAGREGEGETRRRDSSLEMRFGMRGDEADCRLELLRVEGEAAMER